MKSDFLSSKASFAKENKLSSYVPYSYKNCSCCPRNCLVDRTQNTGFCHSPVGIRAARAALHLWEEPCISGLHGSGTVFFSGCTLRCCFCQNYKISSDGFGKNISEMRLEEIFLELQEKGAHNINLVTPTQYLPSLLPVLKKIKPQLSIPIVYNSGGYETLDAVDALAPYIDIWLPDLKYFSNELSAKYSAASDYFQVASAAIKRMIEHTGKLEFEEYSENEKTCQLMKRGVIIRHMILPGNKDDSIKLLHWIHDNLTEGQFLVSLMSQYTPFYKSSCYPEINRRITSYEYQKVVDTAIALGLTHGFMQEKSSAKEEYTPPFELQGI